jgi:DHA1 family inner membrane transport protein
MSGRRSAIAAIAVGALAMTGAALQPMLLETLSQAGRFSAGAAHWASLAELAAMGLTVAAAGTLMNPARLPLIGALAALAYGLANLGAGQVRGDLIVAERALAGVAAGLLIWITIGFLARRERPEPWAAGFFMSQAVGALVFAVVLAGAVLPRTGGVGGEAAAAGLALLALPVAFALPKAYPILADGPLPSARGLLGLLALLLYVTASTGVWFHMRDFAHAAGLGEAPASLAVVSTLMGQIAGAALAVGLAGRVRFAWVFAGVCALTLTAWGVLALRPPMEGFVVAFGVSGFAGMVLGTWLFSFLAETEPSRRAAAISASAQLVGAALGPALQAPLPVSAGLVIASLALVLVLARPQCMALTAGRP